MSTLDVIHVGLGPVGCRIAAVVAERPELRSVGAVDPAPEKVGRDLGELAGLPRPVGVPVVRGIGEVRAPARLAFHSTGSALARVAPQLVDLFAAGFDVISTCEELSYPWHRQPSLAREIDARAREHGVRVLGTGVNPGFVMDTLPLVLALASREVRAIRVRRVVDVARRRLPLRQKVGAGIEVAEFRRGIGTRFGHVGLPESVAMVAAGLGWTIGEVAEQIAPVVSERDRVDGQTTVPAGRVAGVHQRASAQTEDGRTIEHELIMAFQAEDEGDEVVVEGQPPLRLVVPGGVAGDEATAAIVVNLASRLVEAAPGLRTMLDLPLGRARSRES